MVWCAMKTGIVHIVEKSCDDIYKYRYTVKPFLIVPIIGAMFADLLNTGIITLFLNLL